MPPSKKQKGAGKCHAHNTTVTDASNTYIVYYGLNWASFVSTHFFEVSAVENADTLSHFPSRTAAPTQKRKGDDVTKAKEVALGSAALLAAQLPRTAISTTRTALQTAFSAPETLQLPAHAQLTTEVYYVASLWCLHHATTYKVTLSAVGGKKDQKSAAALQATQLTFSTPDFNIPLDLRSEVQHIVEHGALLFHPEFVDCITAQGESNLLFYLPTNLLDARTALPFMHRFWYHGLFTLPESVSISPKDTLLFFLLPNGNERYVLDLTSSRTCTQRATKDSLLNGTEEKGEPTQQADSGCNVSIVAAKENLGVESRKPLFPWRGHSKVRRIIKSGTYTVVVRDEATGVMASLLRAYNYHLARHGSSWLNPTFIRLMGRCCCCGDDDDDEAKGSVCGTFGAQLISVELVDESVGEVVAGCCGMAIGSVYHDYTMYTLRRCKDSLGTFLTKLLGEALQQCGYALWYWGFRVEYMADYEKHFGAMNMPRSTFYLRWCDARDVAPACTVATFLKDGKGMVPYTSKAL